MNTRQPILERRYAACGMYRPPPGLGLSAVALVASLLPATAISADWRFTPSVTLGLGYSDNINLSTPGTEVSDQVLELTPGIDATYDGPRFDADITYRLQALSYRDDSSRDETFNQLAGRATAWLVPDSFSLDALLSVRQQVIDTSAPIPTSTIAGTGNLTDENTAYLSPRWTFRVSENVQGDLRYAASRIDYDEASLSDSDQEALAAVIESTAQPERLYWAAKYRQSRIDFDTPEEIRFEQGTLEVGIPMTARTRFIVLIGDEKNTFRLSDGSDAPDDDFWLIGIRSQRAERYQIEVLAGERVFGNTASLRWTQMGRRWSTEAIYTEDYITYAETRLEIDPREPESILPGPGLGGVAPEVYLRERAQIGATLERPKITLRISVYDEDRRYQTTNNQESLKGVELGVNWRAGSLTTFVLSGGRQENQLAGTNATDQLKLVDLGIERRFGRRVLGSFYLRRADQTSSDPAREYVENSATLSATMTF